MCSSDLFSFLNLILPEKTWKSLNPIILALFAFGFATTIGVFWEIIEYSVDLITGSNMQRHTNSITGIPFEGQEALQDTMRDFMSNAIGALSFSIIGYFNLKKKKFSFFDKLLLQSDKHEEILEEKQMKQIK